VELPPPPPTDRDLDSWGSEKSHPEKCHPEERPPKLTKAEKSHPRCKYGNATQLVTT